MRAADLDPETLREALVAAMREAGALALAKFRQPLKSWTKGKASPVSEVDIAVNDILQARLAAAAPGYGWLSEETPDDDARRAAKRLWIVDPIDGTRGYLAGFPDWSISVALIEDGRPILAAVHAPAEAALYVAMRGAGATCNGARIVATDGERLDGIRAAGPKPLIDALANGGPRIERMPRVNSLTLRLTRVASGALDAAFAGADSHDWDLAAADLLVHEAGGSLTTLDGRVLTYNRPDPVHGALIAAGRVRHHALIAVVRSRGPAFP